MVENKTLDPAAVRLAWRVTEPLHAMVYFVPEAEERFAAIGIPGAAGYFCSRAGALGPVGAGTVAATFYNFCPALIAAVLPAAWERATPPAAMAARLDAAGAALTRGLGKDVLAGPEVAEAARLARRAAESATPYANGRPLFAAYAELPWPEEPHLVLWHAQTVLREFRGDGHVAALLVAGVSGLESMVLHIAAGETDGRFLRRTRGWSRQEWTEATDSLRGRGLIEGDEPTLTDAGRELRAGIEATTDRLGTPPYLVLGEAGCARLAALTRPLSRTIVKAGMLDLANSFVAMS
jgi:hypothetical protein